LHFMGTLLRDIRQSLREGCFKDLKREWLE
jgi:queuine/archaeosine tRNA-ribosyltransferase